MYNAEEMGTRGQEIRLQHSGAIYRCVRFPKKRKEIYNKPYVLYSNDDP